MTLHTLKPRFQSLLRPAVRSLHRAGVSANQVTVSTGVVSVALGAGLAFAADAGQLQWFLLLPPWFLLRMALNAIDGLLAREFGQRSTLGAYLNELSDLVADAALYLPFALLSEAASVPILLVIFLSNLAEMAGLLGIVAGNGRRNDGPMGKSDRALVFGLLGLLLGAGIVPGAWLPLVLAIVALLLLPTIVNRVRHGIAQDGGHADQ